jgi:hypothetical protein
MEDEYQEARRDPISHKLHFTFAYREGGGLDEYQALRADGPQPTFFVYSCHCLLWAGAYAGRQPATREGIEKRRAAVYKGWHGASEPEKTLP